MNEGYIEVSDQNGKIFSSACNDDFLIYTKTQSKLHFGTSNNGNAMLVLDSLRCNVYFPEGKIGIGGGVARDLAATLDVQGSFRVTNGPVNFPDNSISVSSIQGLSSVSFGSTSSQWKNTSNSIYVINSNVGIGTSNPDSNYALDVAGGLRVAGNVSLQKSITMQSLHLLPTDGRVNMTITNDVVNGFSNDSNGVSVFAPTSASNNYIRFMMGQAYEAARLTGNGRLGVGTSNPQFTVDVLGSLRVTSNVSFPIGSIPASAISGTLSQWSTNTSNVVLLGSNIGIGTSTPQFTLDVLGSLRVASNVSFPTGSIPSSAISGTLSQWSTNTSNVFLLGSNVGIGISNPSVALDVVGQARLKGLIIDGDIEFQNNIALQGIRLLPSLNGGPKNVTSTSVAGLSNDNIGVRIFSDNPISSNCIRFITLSNEAMRIDGKFLGVGTSNPTYPLHINGDNNGGGVSIYASHDVAIFSDARKKTNLKKIDDAVAKVCELNGYTFNRSDDFSKNPAFYAGVVAQEVQKVLPEVVRVDKDGVLNVAYGNMVSLLIEAVKELNTRLACIENMKQ